MGTALDTALPKYDIRAAHAIVVAALPARTMWAVRAVTLADMPLVRALFALRALPARRDGGICPAQAPAAAAPFWDLLRRRGFAPLGDTPDELVLGAAGRFWVLWGAPLVPLADAGAFRSFDRPGYARAAITVRVATRPGHAGCVVRTETRVALPDPGARRAFATYWSFIRPFSGLIRLLWLRAIKRRAEGPQGATRETTRGRYRCRLADATCPARPGRGRHRRHRRHRRALGWDNESCVEQLIMARHIDRLLISRIDTQFERLISGPVTLENQFLAGYASPTRPLTGG